MLKDPDTGKRLSRPYPKNDWQTADVPNLRIVSQELFDVLSGLLRCGACGAGMSTNGRTIQDAFASAVQQPPKVVPAKKQRLST
jgi:hypothetical protein